MPLSYQVLARDPDTAARRGQMVTGHGVVETPAFMTVGTRATVTGLDPSDLERIATQVVLGNTYHLMLRPGIEAFHRVGGIHAFMGWTGPVLTDSGGFQIFSLAGDRTVTEQGASFRGYTDQRLHLLSPERSIEMQSAIGSDIMMVLDVCIDSQAEDSAIRQAMERTHRWALRSLAARRNPEQALFAIVQGGISPALRRQSAAFLTDQPFDGYAVGGLAVGDSREQRADIIALSAELIPADKPRYLMGVGTPADLLHAVSVGIDLFDCVLPTHLAWQGTAFTSTGRVRLTRGAMAVADDPLDSQCHCSTCSRFSRSYLHHLFKCREPLGPRLLSLHNLSHYNRLMTEARAAIERGEYRQYCRDTLAAIDRLEHSNHRPGKRAQA